MVVCRQGFPPSAILIQWDILPTRNIATTLQRQPRIKIYQDSNGMPKGDGLVTFLKEPSVDLAVQLLDGVAFRYGLQVRRNVP